MRWKAFASADVLNQVENGLLSAIEARNIIQMTCTRWDCPQECGGSSFDYQSREGFLYPTAGFGTGGGWKPSEDVALGPVLSIPEHLRSKNRKAGAEQGAADAAEDDTVEEAAVSAPLGGWPGLLQGKAFEEAPDVPARRRLSVEIGAIVEIVGLKKTGTGVVVDVCSDGKWKIRLDSENGTALLSEDYLRVLPPRKPLTGWALEKHEQKEREKRDREKQAAKDRALAVEAKKAALQAKYAMRSVQMTQASTTA
jgi:hypothetical protein